MPWKKFDTGSRIFILAIFVLLLISVFVLRSLAPFVFPTYLIYIVVSLVVFFFLLLKVDFEVLSIFSPHLYVLSIFLLIVPLLIGEISRGAIRWIPLGPITIQPSELVRPFLLLFLANYVIQEELTLIHLAKSFGLFFIPFVLILIQPSLGIALLTLVGFLGVMLASSIKKSYFLVVLFLFIVLAPLIWFVLLPYQRQRIISFVEPYSDPLGSGYNSIQAMITVGSGRLFGRGLGEGVQTQLAFLPERHTDFIFAGISEELGFLGATLVLFTLFVILWSVINISANAQNPIARAYTTGVFFVLFTQTLVHTGMNMGLLPITGIPLPFLSAGGSTLLGTMISLAIAIRGKRRLV